MEIDLAGHGAGLYDQLFVSGNLSLAGALSLVPQAGFSEAQGDVFDIITVQGSRSGTFSSYAEGSSISVGGSNLYLTTWLVTVMTSR